mgnify:FL=1
MPDEVIKTAAPICRAQNPELDVVKRFLNAMPNYDMPKKDYDNATEAKFSGWTSTHYQMAKQMALYYTKGDVCHPRFKNNVTTENILKYMGVWARKYYAPNPFTKDLNKYQEAKPTVLYAYFADCIRKGVTSYKEACEHLFGDIQLNNMDKVKLMLNSFTDIYIDQSGNMAFQKWSPAIVPPLVPNVEHPLDEVCFFNYFGDSTTKELSLISESTLQKIFYGAPGTGKSHTVDTDYVKDNKCFRITFHPDTDYASFVGCYKPKMGGPTGEDITYSFVPQVFLNAYIYAWNHPDEPTYLVIEELNRGNCAQIFGDIFQLLDRQKTGHPGYSKYTINADSDIATYLSGELKDKESYEKVIREIYGPKEFDFSILALPSNLNILATMNTSDQSLFPIDSAFKRRWGMEYVGVNYTDAEQFTVVIDETHKYSWSEILKGLNGYIKQEKHSTNKILGNRFVQSDENNVISAVAFRDKVLFFLFNDVFKEEDEFRTDFFGGNDELYFEDLCEGDGWTTYVINFIEKTCGTSNKSNTQQPDGVTPQQSEKESTTETE